MATFVLVHPAWFGGWCWKKVVPLLRAQGHAVHTPTLTGLGERAHLAHPGVGMHTHIEDVVNVLTYEGLDGVVMVGTSSSGAVITGVAERVPELVSQLVYVDGFVPADGECVADLIPPGRRPAMETLVETEGFGWLLPRFAPPPWLQFVQQSWQITDDADLAWMLRRLRPTPFGHFTGAVRVGNPQAAELPRTFVRCVKWPHPGFDKSAETARTTPGWRYRDLDTSHLPYITNPDLLAATLHELVEEPTTADSRAST